MDLLTKPFGNTLQQLVMPSDAANQLKIEAEHYPSITLSNRQLCDLEMLANGAYSPLTRFMDQATYESVVHHCTLPDGSIWPIPIVLDISEALANTLAIGSPLALRDNEGFMLAVVIVEERWQADKTFEAKQVYGTQSLDHSGVAYLMEQTQAVYISGILQVVQLPEHYVFSTFRHTPQALRHLFTAMSWNKVLGYQTSTPIHQLHHDVLLDAAKHYQTHLLIHPTVGSTKPGDTHYFHRVRCYESILHTFPLNIAMLSLMPYSMRMAGPRETLLHAIVQQNYGCSHFLVGPHHSSPTSSMAEHGETYYGQYDAQALVKQYQDQLGISMVAVEEYQYQSCRGKYRPKSLIKRDNEEGLTLSETNFRRRLHEGIPIPTWFSFPAVIDELKTLYKPRSEQGFTVFFTGLSGSGKSTLAKIVYAKLVEHGKRPVTLLDGDVVRLNLSSELGFSKPHRDLNIRRIGFVASEISKNGGIAICAPIAPYAQGRRAVRSLIEEEGAFIEVHVATPLEECEARDRKGLYAKARKGIIPEFTGISDPYDIPENPELSIDTTNISPNDGAQQVLLYLLQRGFLD